jgi:hypothetical protein
MEDGPVKQLVIITSSLTFLTNPTAMTYCGTKIN